MYIQNGRWVFKILLKGPALSPGTLSTGHLLGNPAFRAAAALANCRAEER